MNEELNEAVVHLRAMNAVLANLTGPHPREDQQAAKDSAIQQAQQWAQEARTHRSTVLDILRYFGLPERDWEALSLIKAKLEAAPAAQPADSAMTDEQIEEIAHRKAWHYLHNSSNPNDSANSEYTFNRATLLEFARALTAASKERSKP
jgi:hypothetical protein